MSNSPDSLLSLREILGILFERKMSVAAVFFGVVITTVVLVFFVVTPNYEAKAKLVLNLNDLTGPILSAGSFVSDMEKLTDFHTQKDIIGSTVFAERVVDSLGLATSRELSRVELIKLYLKGIKRDIGEALGIEKWKKEHDPRAASIAAVSKNFTLNSKPESRAFELIYRARNPEEAEDTLNGIIKEYTKYHHESLNARATGCIDYLEKQIKRVSGQLADAEQEMLDFRNKTTDALQHAPTGNTDSDNEISFIGVTDSIEIQDELKLYILKMEEELRTLETRYSKDDKKILVLKEKINSYINTVNSLPDKDLELMRLKRGISLNEEIYLFTQKNLEQIKVVAVGQTAKLSRISVLEWANADDTPVSPLKGLLIFLSVILGLSLGIFWAYFVHFLDHTIGSVRDIESYLGLRNLGYLPEQKENFKSSKRKS